MSDHQTYRFTGFISYSQKDRRWARRIHRALEAYRLPVGVPGADAKVHRLGRFFRDDDELAGAPSLGAALTGALDDSRTLIVVCSPNSARSKWVDAEIAHFRSRGPHARVLAVIVAGRPDSDDPDVMCFAPSLLRKVDARGEPTDEPDEPLAPDVTREPFDRLIARLVAGILGVEFDTLWQRERRRKRRRRLVTGVAAVAAVAASVAGYLVYLDEERARLVQESINLAATAQQAAEEGRVDEALALALSALPRSVEAPERPIVPAADAALRRVMAGSLSAGVLARFEQAVDGLKLLDGNEVAVRLADGAIKVLDATGGETLRAFEARERLAWSGDGSLAWSSGSDERVDDTGGIRIDHVLIVRDLRSGEVVGELHHRDDHRWLGPVAPISADGARVLVRAALGAPADERDDLFIWSVPPVGSGGVPDEVAQVDAPFVDHDSLVQAAFVADERVALFWGEARNGAALWNTATGEARVLVRGEDPLACPGQLDAGGERRDDLRLSVDRSIISHARPIAGGGWCVALWQAASGAALEPIVIEPDRIGGVDALDTDTLVVAPGYRSFVPAAGLWKRGAGELVSLPCATRGASVLTPVASEARWLMRPAVPLAACASQNRISIRLGRQYDVGLQLAGHAQDVQALAYDEAGQRLYSGADDGEVRAWDLSGAPRPVALPGRVIRIEAWRGRVALLHQSDSGDIEVALFQPDGDPHAAALPFEVAGLSRGEPPRGRVDLAVVPLAGAALVQVESWQCGMMGCPPGTPRRAALMDTATGKPLAVLEDLAAGGFLASMPAALAWNVERSRLAAATRDGEVLLVDVATGAVKRSTLPDGSRARQTGWVAGVLWVLASDGAEAPEERHMLLYRQVAGGGFEQVARDQAQTGQLFVSASGRRAIVASAPVPGPGSRPGYRFITAQSAGPSFTMPHESAQGESLATAMFFDSDRSVALLFSENSVPPQRVPVPESVAEAPAAGAIEPLAANLPASMIDTWRSDDPLGRAIVSVDDGRFFMLPLGGDGVCAASIGSPADAAAFSPGGTFIAVSESASGQTRIFRTADCALVSVQTNGVLNNTGRLVFADEEHLWSLSDAGVAHVVRMAGDLSEVLARALKLARVRASASASE